MREGKTEFIASDDPMIMDGENGIYLSVQRSFVVFFDSIDVMDRCDLSFIDKNVLENDSSLTEGCFQMPDVLPEFL